MPRIPYSPPLRSKCISAMGPVSVLVLAAGSLAAQTPGSVNLNPTPPPDATYPVYSDVASTLGNPGTEFDGPDVGRGVAWVDVVGHDPGDPALPGPPDGLLDLVVANSNSPALPLGAPPGSELTPAIGSNPGPCSVYRAEADGTFTDVTLMMGTTGIGFDIAYPGGSPFGVVAGDMDGDGDQDLFFACGGFNTSSINGLLANDGDGTFTYVSTSSGGMPENQVSFGGSWFDYDLDGHLDLYVTNAVDILEGFFNGPPDPDPTDRLYRNDGTGSFTEVSTAARTGLKSNGFGVVTADLDNDGWTDIAVSCMKNYNKVFYNLGNGSFSFMAPPSNPFVSMDIVTDMVEEESGAWELAFVPPNGLTILPMAGHVSLPVEVADMNGDGWLDVLYGVWSAQLPDSDPESGAGALYGGAERQYLYLNAGDTDGDGVGEGIYREVGIGTGYNHVAGTMGLLVADFNLDGWMDVYAGNGGPDVSVQLEEDFLYINNGPSWPEDFLSNPMIPLPQTLYEIGALAGVYSNTFMAHGVMMRQSSNGLDIYVANGGPALLNQGQTNVYYANQGASDGSTYRALEVSLQEDVSAPNAFGTRVTVFRGHLPSGELLQNLQERRSSFGFNSSDHGPLVFGLGRDHPAFVEARWPSGIRQGQSLFDRPATAPLLLAEPTLSLAARLDLAGTELVVDLDNRDAAPVTATLELQTLRLKRDNVATQVGGVWTSPARGWNAGPVQDLGPLTVPAGGTLQVTETLPAAQRPVLHVFTLRATGDGSVLNQAQVWVDPAAGLRVDPRGDRLAGARLAGLAGLSAARPWSGDLRPTPETPGAAYPVLPVSNELRLSAEALSLRAPLSDEVDTRELDGEGFLPLAGGVRLDWRDGRARLTLPPGFTARVEPAPEGGDALVVTLGLPEACCERTARQPIRFLRFEGVTGRLRADGRPFNPALQPIGPRLAPRRLR